MYSVAPRIPQTNATHLRLGSTPLNKRSVSRSLSLLPPPLLPPSPGGRVVTASSTPVFRAAPSQPFFPHPSHSSYRPHPSPLPPFARAGIQRRAVSRTQRPDCRTPGEICQSPPITGISRCPLFIFALSSRCGFTKRRRGGGETGRKVAESGKGEKEGGEGRRETGWSLRRWKCIEMRETMDATVQGSRKSVRLISFNPLPPSRGGRDLPVIRDTT